ncbi:acyltransferase [Aquimarina sp. AD1]|uniref:acyltransferase n=1 Tax=Aquimarina sp. (strain AD1) TaxID=1714848 RepID=UPI000E4CA90B|nr:acyltransferase [Aquimarina sp. AD1]AXT57331.1 acyltransferase [Aquimarina sp. AD1]RKN09918.1 acyltransferase [Aquimarina sp. AD1]
MVYSLVKSFLRKLKIKKIKKNLGKVGSNFVWKGSYVEYPENVEIGNNVYIGPEARLHGLGGIKIGDGVISGPRLTIYTYNHNYINAKYLPYDEVHLLKEVTIKNNVWLGDSVSILPGVTIGEGSIIGMRSVIVKDIPPFSIVGGNPAKVIKKRVDIDNYASLNLESKNYLFNKDKHGLKPILKRIRKDAE